MAGGRTELWTLKPLVEMVGVVAAQLSVLGSVLIYFGTVATRVEARFFGLDPSQLGYSNQELLVRSIAPMLGPLTVGGALAVFALQLNAAAADRSAWLGSLSRSRMALRAVAALGLVLLAVGAAWQWRLGSRHSYWSPLFLGAGAVLLIAARGTTAMLRARGGDRRSRSDIRDAGADTADEELLPASPPSPIRALDAQSKLILGLVIVFALFGFTARLAEADGFNRALTQVSNLGDRATVTVLAEEPLIVSRRGVACFPVADSRFTRRYTGFHLIAYRSERYFLVPSGFDVNNGVMIVLPDDGDIRVEYDATPQLRAVEGLPRRPAIVSPDPDLRC